MRMLSEHFSYDELKCPCCGACEMKQATLSMAEDLRRFLNRPLHPNSGYRCLAHNAKVGGKEDSRHLFGEAIDFRCLDTKSKYEMVEAMISIGFGGVGIGEDFVHGDIRDLDSCRLWIYP